MMGILLPHYRQPNQETVFYIEVSTRQFKKNQDSGHDNTIKAPLFFLHINRWSFLAAANLTFNHSLSTPQICFESKTFIKIIFFLGIYKKESSSNCLGKKGEMPFYMDLKNILSIILCWGKGLTHALQHQLPCIHFYFFCKYYLCGWDYVNVYVCY